MPKLGGSCNPAYIGPLPHRPNVPILRWHVAELRTGLSDTLFLAGVTVPIHRRSILLHALPPLGETQPVAVDIGEGHGGTCIGCFHHRRRTAGSKILQKGGML